MTYAECLAKAEAGLDRVIARVIAQELQRLHRVSLRMKRRRNIWSFFSTGTPPTWPRGGRRRWIKSAPGCSARMARRFTDAPT
jgi:hypothetical protein